MPNDDPSTERGPDRRREGGRDVVLERAALALLLSLHPSRLSQGELTRILAADPEDSAQRDAVRAALAHLISVGLLHRDAHLLAPSEAALYFDRLMTL